MGVDRPSFIYVEIFDPWDEQLICSMTLKYCRRLSGLGYYSKKIRRVMSGVKYFAPQIIESREPKCRIKLSYALWEQGLKL